MTGEAAQRRDPAHAWSGVFSASSSAHRNRVWQAPRVLTAMDAFAGRAGRRA